MDAFTYNILLDQRHLFYRKLHAEVATGYHHPIRFKNDLAEIGKRFRHLDLGHDLGFAFFLLQNASQDLYIINFPYKRKRYPVYLLLNHKIQVRKVFFCKCWKRDLCVGEVYSFFGKEYTRHSNFYLYIFIFSYLNHLYLYLPVIYQYLIAYFNICSKIGIGYIYFFPGAYTFFVGKRKDIAGHKRHRAVFYFTYS